MPRYQRFPMDLKIKLHLQSELAFRRIRNSWYWYLLTGINSLELKLSWSLQGLLFLSLKNPWPRQGSMSSRKSFLLYILCLSRHLLSLTHGADHVYRQDSKKEKSGRSNHLPVNRFEFSSYFPLYFLPLSQARNKSPILRGREMFQ